MGKYIRQQKAKPVADVALMDIAQSSIGVRTRAKTLALKQLQKSEPAYLQLRSRRLEKPPIAVKICQSRRQRQRPGVIRPGPKSPNPLSNCSMKVKKRGREERSDGYDVVEGSAAGVEKASTGENVLGLEDGERGTRESTPCCLIRVPESIRTPGSSNRSTCSVATRARNPMPIHIPLVHDTDEFFAGAEERQRQEFIDKYNFDPAKEVPLPGRYEWVKLTPKP